MRTSLYTCVHVCPVTVVTSTVHCATFSDSTLLPSSPSQAEVMSFHADGAQEMKLVYLTSLFLCFYLLHCMQEFQGLASGRWPDSQVPILCCQIFPQPIKIKHIVVVIK